MQNQMRHSLIRWLFTGHRPPATASRLPAWVVLTLSILAGWGLLGRPLASYGQEKPSPESVLKELERLDPKAAAPRLRPAAGTAAAQPSTPTAQAPADTAAPAKVAAISVVIDTASYRGLSPARQKLLEAYDNFMQLLPAHGKVPEVLYNKGYIFFEMKMYPNARGVFANLLEKYPKSGKFYVDALANIVDSYRQEKDFQNLETWSERLRTDPNAPDSLRQAGEKLAAGAIASQASQLAASTQTADLLKAAETYIRTARTYPKSEVASISLFNAGYTYKKAKVYDKAADTWLDLVQKYPAITYADTAVWESGLAYDELKDYKRAIDVYERFIKEYPKSEFIADAMTNTVSDYTELQDWKNVARVYEMYATQFSDKAGPDRSFRLGQAWIKAGDLDRAGVAFDRFSKENPASPLAKQVQYELGQAWIKAGDLVKANVAFDRFARENPTSPLAVKIKYDIGQYYYDRKQTADSKRYFEDTVALSLDIEKKGQDANLYYRGEAYLKLADMLYPDYETIKLALPKTAFDQSYERKKNLFKRLSDYYLGVVKSGSVKGAEAAYRLSLAYEEMANAWLKQDQPPPPTDVMKRIEQTKAFYQTAAGFLNDAINPLETVNLKHADDYADIIADTTWNATRDSVVAVTPRDTTENVWVTKAKDKVVELATRIGDLFFDLQQNYFDVPVPPLVQKAGVIGLTIFRNQGLTAVATNIDQQVIPLYQRAVKYGDPPPDGYSITSRAVQRAKESAVRAARLTADKSAALAPPLLDTYRTSIARLAGTVDTLAYRPETLKDSFAFGDKIYAVLDGGEIPSYLEPSLELARNVGPKYEDVLTLANTLALESGVVDSVRERLAQFYYETGLAYQTAYQNLDDLTVRYQTRVSQIDSIVAAGGKMAVIYQNAQVQQTLNDIMTNANGMEDMKTTLQNGAIETYETGYGYQETYPIRGDWYNKIRTQLTTLDPDRYPPPSEAFRVVIGSDPSWMVGPDATSGWNMTGFNPSPSWGAAKSGVFPADIRSLPGLSTSSASTIWSSVTDSVIYARREFDFYGKPDSCRLVIAATGPYAIFINGLNVGKEDTADPRTPKVYDITKDLRGASRNIIAIQAASAGLGDRGLVVEVRGRDRVLLDSEKLNAARQYYQTAPR